MKRLFLLYRNAFGGLSRPAWMMSLVMFINRSGAMVTPFLAVYLTEVLDYSLKEAGMILSIYGLGSVCGSFLGGWLTDRVGHFKVQFLSLTAGGSLYFLLINLQQFEYMAAGVFILSLVNDTLRPANSASISYYARPENVTRAFSLNRMAINLGFSIGPALGGFLAAISYHWLFVANGITCISAGIFFFFYFRAQQGHRPKLKKEKTTQSQSATPADRSPYRDVPFILFTVLCCSFAAVFFQFITTLPLYYRQEYQLSETGIGGMLAFNGFVVFSLEMIAVYLIGDKIRKSVLIVTGMLILGFSFVLLNLSAGVGILFLAMLLLSLSEILVMPFIATIAVERSTESNRGAYMGLHTISYSAAHVVAPFLGTTIASRYSFDTLWWSVGGLAIVTAAGFYFVVQYMERERLSKRPVVSPEADMAAI